MTANPDFRSQLMPAFSPAQADAIVAGRKTIPLVACLEAGPAARAHAAKLGVQLLVDSWLQNP